MTHARDVAAAIRQQNNGVNGDLQLHKLLYYCQSWHLVWTGRPLFEEPIEAWEMGPVVADLWREEKYGPTTLAEPLNDEELRTVVYVCDRYGDLPGKALRELSHNEPPWRGTARNGFIRHDVMRDYYSSDPAAAQAWFWTDRWLDMEAEATADIEAGRVSEPTDIDSFLSSL